MLSQHLVRVTQLDPTGEVVDTQDYPVEDLWAATESTKDEQERLTREHEKWLRGEVWARAVRVPRRVRLFLVVDDGDEWVSYEVNTSQDLTGYLAQVRPLALQDQHS